MARTPRTGSPAAQPKPSFTRSQLDRALERLDARIAELEAFNVSRVPKGSSPELSALEAAIQDTLVRAFGEDTAATKRFSPAAHLQFRPMAFSDNYPLQQHYQQGARDRIDQSLALLKEAKRVVQEEITELEPAEAARPAARRPPVSRKVFVVHGHDEAALQTLARFLEHLELEAIVLKEQPDQGRTIIEKFEACSSDVAFAVVLMTPDDVGGAKATPDEAQARARQNVVFELGYFASKLGRGKVCLLRRGALEMPSDLYGVIYTDLDGSEGWKLKLGRELRAAGLDVDMNRCC